jgi:hypothetical protein
LRQDKSLQLCSMQANALGALKEKYELSKWSTGKCKQEGRTKCRRYIFKRRKLRGMRLVSGKNACHTIGLGVNPNNLFGHKEVMIP